MANKIQVKTVEMTANVEVIPMNSYIVARCVRTHAFVKNLVETNKSERKTYNEEHKEWEKALDENGNQMYNYRNVSVEEIEEHILPLLDEFMAAFGV